MVLAESQNAPKCGHWNLGTELAIELIAVDCAQLNFERRWRSWCAEFRFLEAVEMRSKGI